MRLGIGTKWPVSRRVFRRGETSKVDRVSNFLFLFSFSRFIIKKGNRILFRTNWQSVLFVWYIQIPEKLQKSKSYKNYDIHFRWAENKSVETSITFHHWQPSITNMWRIEIRNLIFKLLPLVRIWNGPRYPMEYWKYDFIRITVFLLRAFNQKLSLQIAIKINSKYFFFVFCIATRNQRNR